MGACGTEEIHSNSIKNVYTGTISSLVNIFFKEYLLSTLIFINLEPYNNLKTNP